MSSLEKRIKEIEIELTEMKARMIEFENVMSTAFGLIVDGVRPKRVSNGK